MLLERVDTVLMAGGAPAIDPLWLLLRQTRALPGDVVAHLVAVTPQTLVDRSLFLREQGLVYETAVDQVPLPGTWRGAAAERFIAAWSSLVAHLVGEPTTSVAGRLRGLGSYLDDVAEWLVDSRARLASTLADCLTCAEAVVLGAISASGPAAAAAPERVRAASAIGGHVLQVAADIVADGHTIGQRWADITAELRYQPDSLPMGPAPAVELG
jgi:hypothetical protein